jgi:hypothetical protein
VAFFYRGGQRQAVKMGDNEVSKHFFDLMTAMSEPEKDLFLGGVQAVNAAFQASITHAPRFLIGTLIRDNVTRMFFPRAQGAIGRVPFAQDLAGIYTMMFDRSFYRAYQEQGGIRGGAYYPRGQRDQSERLSKSAAAASSGLPQLARWTIWRRPIPSRRRRPRWSKSRRRWCAPARSTASP